MEIETQTAQSSDTHVWTVDSQRAAAEGIVISTGLASTSFLYVKQENSNIDLITHSEY